MIVVNEQGFSERSIHSAIVGEGFFLIIVFGHEIDQLNDGEWEGTYSNRLRTRLYPGGRLIIASHSVGDQKVRLDSELQVTGVELLEVLSFFQSLMFTLLKDRPTDQTWFMRKFREKWNDPDESSIGVIPRGARQHSWGVDNRVRVEGDSK